MKAEEDIKRLPTILEILDTIASEEEWLRNEPKFGFLLSNLGAEDKYEVFSGTPDGPSVLKPTSSVFNSYFRGQTCYYENCVPTLFRQDDKNGPIDRFIDVVRSCEFELLISTHPFVNYVFNKGVNIPMPDNSIVTIPLKVDTEGLAEHYGFRTTRLDFTNDKWVAAFFAVCEKVNGSYQPVTNNKCGVFYRYSQPPKDFFLTDHQSFRRSKLSVIGLQPFARPGEQKAFTLQLDPHENLNSYPCVQKYEFRHDDLASEIVFNRLNGGKDLFPPDEIEIYAQRIQESKKLSRDALICAMKRYDMNGLSKDDLIKLCLETGIKIVPYRVFRFPRNLEKTFLKDWRKDGEKDFYSKIVYRTVFG